jgi:uncharacterized membrane protein YtjA (UPF0391 family)
MHSKALCAALYRHGSLGRAKVDDLLSEIFSDWHNGCDIHPSSVVNGRVAAWQRANSPTKCCPSKRRFIMLRLALTFLVVALISAFLGFGGVASLSFEAARILFFISLVLAVLFFIGNGFRSMPPP